MDTYNEVLFEEMSGNDGDLGIITLNRPSVLNSLNHSMISVMHAQLKRWASAAHIKAVVIRAAEGRAFCAGGDIRLTYERHQAKDPAQFDFFRDEYQLNRFIFHYPKPYIALLDGITMGGGVGISIHGSHRVATDRLLFAMPETGIGFFPDVGGTYFLPRLPGRTGFYLGLTGVKINSDDCVALGIAQQKVASESLSSLLAALAEKSFSPDANDTVTQIINEFQVKKSESILIKEQSEIDACFSFNNMESIISALKQSTSSICQEAIPILAKKSPTSLKVSLKAMESGKHLDFDAVMQQEYRLTCHFLEGHDFPEGIRALIIDKDQSPHWKPATLVEVSETLVNSFFSSLKAELVI